jgi:hypothetical protein
MAGTSIRSNTCAPPAVKLFSPFLSNLSLYFNFLIEANCFMIVLLCACGARFSCLDEISRD